MDAFADYVSQHVARNEGSENGNTTRGSLNKTSFFSSDQDHTKCGFRPWVLIALFSLHWIASWAITITGIILIFKPFSENVPCHVFYLMVYLRAGYWVGTYQLNEATKDPCRRLLDENFEWYQCLRTYRKAPLQIVSFWNTALFAVNGYAKNFFEQSGMGNSGGSCKQPLDNDLLDALRSPQMVIVIFCAVESLALSCFYPMAFARLMEASGQSAGQYTEHRDHLKAEQTLRQQAEQIKMLEKTRGKLKKRAAEIGLLEDY